MKARMVVLFGVTSIAACAPHAPPGGETAREEAPAASPGWQTVGDTRCYRAPDFATLPPPERKSARSDALYEVTRRWRGGVDPTFQLPDDLVDALETLLLQKPTYVQRVVDEDFELCRRWAAGTLSGPAYAEALRTLLEELQRGVCSHEPYELVTQYLEVDRGWQFELTICQGERVTIEASRGYYTIDAGADGGGEPVWVTAEGDRSRPTVGTDYPCHEEGCYAGQLLGRFEDRSGRVWIFPINFETRFEAPSDGELSFAINDIDLYDNRFRVVDGVKDCLLVEIRPAGSEGPSPGE